MATKEKAVEKEANPVYQLAAFAASGSISMAEAKRRLREWFKKQEFDAKDQEVKQQLFTEAERVTRQLAMASEALSQEFTTIVSGL